jgi:DNA-binding NtrC family response regulator
MAEPSADKPIDTRKPSANAISEKLITVLHVDDEPGFAEMVAEFLEREADRLSVKTVTNARAGLDQTRRGLPRLCGF